MAWGEGMADINVRGLADPVMEALKKQAAAESTSVNALVVRLLEEAAGIRQASYGLRRYDDLDDLIGTWTDEEFAEFKANTAMFEELDPEQWTKQP